MTEKQIRKLLHQAKDTELRRIGRYKASGREEQERIFAHVRRQQGTPLTAPSAEPEITRTEKNVKWDWLHGVGTAAAICAMLALTVGSITFFRNRAPESPLDAASNPVTTTAEESRIPFAAEIAGKELTFNLDTGINTFSLSEEQEQAFLQALETLRWEQKGGYHATNETPYAVSGSSFTMYAGNGTPDGYCVTFARDEGDVLCSSIQDGSNILIYSLSAEEYSRLFKLAAAGMTGNDVYSLCRAWDIKAARSEGLTVEIPHERSEQFWEAFKDVRLDYTKMIDLLPDTGSEFTVTCFLGAPQVVEEMQPYQIVFYKDRLLWYPCYDAPTQTGREIVKQFGISPEDCNKLQSILFADDSLYPLHLFLDAQNVTRCGVTLRLYEIAGGPTGEVMYGSDFSLERYADRTWQPCPQVIDNAAFTSEGYLYNGEITMLPIDWRWIYGTLETGHYRIGKGFSAKQELSEEYTHYTLYAEFDISDDMGDSVTLAELPFPAESIGTDDIVGLEAAYAPYLAKIPADVQQKLADAMERSYWIPVAQSDTWDGETTSLFVRGKAAGTPYRLEFGGASSDVKVYIGDAETPLVYQISWELKAAAEHALDYLQNTDDVMQYLIPCEIEKLTVSGVWEAVDTADSNSTSLSQESEQIIQKAADFLKFQRDIRSSEPDTINWSQPEAVKINRLPDSYQEVVQLEWKPGSERTGTFWQVTFHTPQDELLGPEIVYLTEDGTVIGLGYRE